MNLFIDSTNCTTNMCHLGGIFNTDKSPLSLNSVCCGHRKGYTAIYSLLFSQFTDKKINIAEIGIEAGASLLLWNEYFKNANIYAFELDDHKIEKCKNMNIKNVIYNKIDVSNKDSINSSFNDTNVFFDLIIDDSTHEIHHQNNVINNSAKFLNKGGILIIEDIKRNTDISVFNINTDHWFYYTLITCHHNNRLCDDNDVILYLVKK